MIITLSDTAGFCFGVRRAVELVEQTAAEGKRVVTLGPVVHNHHVAERFAALGVREADEVSQIPEGSTVVIRAHGVGRSVYEALEARGLVSPVVSLDCRYRLTTRFAETVSVFVRVESCSGVRLCFGYTMKNAAGGTVFEGRSEHCFLNTAGQPVRLTRELPDFYAALCAAAAGE